MHLEIRKKGKRKVYYLAHSFRDEGKVRKIRRYLGIDLSEKKLRKIRQQAEEAMKGQMEIYKVIRDPFRTVLSSKEVREVENLISRKEIKINHLSEEEWKRFTELFTYSTNAIEGSTVNLSEVKDILERNKWPPKSKEEISETYGVAEAIEYIRKTRDHLSINLMKKLHKITFNNSKSFAGKLRGKGVEVVIADGFGNIVHRGAPQRQVNGLLKELVSWYRKNKTKYHPILIAAVIHNQFENIHPFQDGNGRVGRLILNNILLKHNFPPVNIDFKNRSEYYLALQDYEKRGNIRPTIELILKEYKIFRKNSRKGG